jgi:hypothetical protein
MTAARRTVGGAAALAACLLLPGAALAVEVRPAATLPTVERTEQRRPAMVAASDLLAAIRVERERPAGYQRALFPHWLDVDGDGCDAREQVLRRDSASLPQVDPFRCFVVEGDWVSPYDGVATSDRTRVDIDHVVALKEAWDSGAWGWSPAQRTAFANDTSDPRSLRATSASSNRSKSDKDPSNWLPPRAAFRCTYVAEWVAIKARWGLSMDESEFGRVRNLLSAECAGTLTAALPPLPVGAPAPSPGAAPVASPSDTAPPAAPGTASGDQQAAQTVHPGAWCSPVGARGTSSSGRAYVCSTTSANGTPYSGGRARWRQG